MADITWIKLKTKIFDDEKIRLIEAMPEADAILIIWLKLLIQAGKANSSGDILLSENIPYSPEMLATIFRRPLQILKFALETLVELGMIEVTKSNVISIINWEKHQNIEGLDKIREQNRIRQSKHRESKKLISTQNQTKNNVTVTQRNAIDLDIKNKNKKENKMTKDMFELFWEKYPKKVDKAKSKIKFLKLNSELFETIMYALEYQSQSDQWKKGFIPNPTTWINGERWDDQIEKSIPGKSNYYLDQLDKI